MTDDLEKSIGTKEATKLSAGSITVKSITIEPAKEGSKANIVKFHCKHKDKEELIILSNAMFKKTQGNNINIKKDALWYNLDEDGNIRKTSNIAEVLRFYHKENLKQFIGQEITTETDPAGYLTIKAY